MGPAPTPATALPPDGRKGRAPKCPYDLGEAGKTWWAWAWKTPQATQWDTGSLYIVGRRAQLEDDLAALDQFDPHALDWLFAGTAPDEEMLQALAMIIGSLKGLAGGRLAVLQKMAELDDRLGLNPKALAALKWSIMAPPEEGGDEDDLARKRRAKRLAGQSAAGANSPT